MDEPTQAMSGGDEVQQAMQLWSESLAQVLGQIAGSSFGVNNTEAAPAEAVPPDKTDVQVMITAAGSLRGEMSWRLPQSSALSLAQLLLSESQNSSAQFLPETKEACEELLRQVAGQAATAFKSRWGEVHWRLDFGTTPAWPPAKSGWLGSAAGAAASFWLEWQVSAALAAALRAPAAEPLPAPPPAPAAADAPPVVVDSKLDLVIDVELDVTVRFGGRRMLLREILELGPGSVVELDRQVQEPADLLLEGRLIARGEVVVVDGNYGLRVTEVISPPSPPGARL